jgi:hypothetical protein
MDVVLYSVRVDVPKSRKSVLGNSKSERPRDDPATESKKNSTGGPDVGVGDLPSTLLRSRSSTRKLLQPLAPACPCKRPRETCDSRKCIAGSNCDERRGQPYLMKKEGRDNPHSNLPITMTPAISSGGQRLGKPWPVEYPDQCTQWQRQQSLS